MSSIIDELAKEGHPNLGMTGRASVTVATVAVASNSPGAVQIVILVAGGDTGALDRVDCHNRVSI